MYFVLLVGVTLWLNSLVFKRLYGLYDSFLYYCLSLLKATWRVAQLVVVFVMCHSIILY